jgi:hypothetical protein
MDNELILELVGAALAMMIFTGVMLTLFVRWSKKDRPNSWKF